LRALIVTCPEPLRAELRPLTRARLLRLLRAKRPRRHTDRQLRGTLLAMQLLAVRIDALTLEERTLKQEILPLARELAPQLLAEPGVGPITAASILLAWSHKGRLRNEAAFAQRSEEHTSELQSRGHLVCRLLLEKKKIIASN